MYVQVNYKFMHPQNKKLRNGSLIVEAKNAQEARTKAEAELAKEYEKFKINSVQEF